MTRKIIAAAIYDGLLGFEYGIAAEMFGLVRPGMEKNWYDFRPCRVEKGELTSTHGLSFSPRHGLRQLVEADTVIVPGWRRPKTGDDHKPPQTAFIKALRAAHDNGARIISICSGVFALGYAGLLDRKKVTSHWLHTEELQRQFPGANVIRDRLYVHDGQISTSAGSSAGLDLCLSIIRKDFGVDVASCIARRMVAPVHREGGQSQYIETPVLAVDDPEFGPIFDWLNENMAKTFTLKQVADRFSMSLRTFQRRFQQLTGCPPLNWINKNRVSLAQGLLESTDQSMEQIAHHSGLGSTANMRKHFARILGTTPSAYRSTFKSNH